MTKRFIPHIRAAIELRRGNPERAVELLRPAQPWELGWNGGLTGIYLRGLAYLDSGQGADAAAEFQKIIDHPTINAVSWVVPLARLGLARAYALSGDTTTGRRHYQDFLALWKDADPDIPILLEARAEYAALTD